MNSAQIKQQIAAMEQQLQELKALVAPAPLPTLAEPTMPITVIAPRRIIPAPARIRCAEKKWVISNNNGRVVIKHNPNHSSFRNQFVGRLVYSDPMAVTATPEPQGRGVVRAEKRDEQDRTRTQRKKARRAGEKLEMTVEQKEYALALQEILAAKAVERAKRQAKHAAKIAERRAKSSNKKADKKAAKADKQERTSKARGSK